MQFRMMTLLDVLGKIHVAWVRYDVLSKGKISDIRCARKTSAVPLPNYSIFSDITIDYQSGIVGEPR